MEKRRLSQVSDGNEETTLGGAGNGPGEPKKPRGLGLEGAETGQRNERKAEEEEVDEQVASGAPEDANTARGVAEDGGKHGTVPVDAPADEGTTPSSNLSSKVEAPGPHKEEAPRNPPGEANETYLVLARSQALTGDTHRDRWLDRLVQALRCSNDKGSVEKREKGSSTCSRAANIVDAVDDAGERLRSPDNVIPAVVALERAAHDALGSDFRKYNQKLRQLDFNLKNNALLAKRFLKKELEPLVILNMTPQELKDGLTAAERTKQEPQDPQYIQMTDTKCSRCMKKRVGVVDIIHAGGSGDRYQLECAGCGHSWTATADAISSLTIKAPSSVDNVGAAPWATAKFEDVEKRLLSPHESDANDLFQKATAPYVPVLEHDHYRHHHHHHHHTSSNSSRREDASERSPITDRNLPPVAG